MGALYGRYGAPSRAPRGRLGVAPPRSGAVNAGCRRDGRQTAWWGAWGAPCPAWVWKKPWTAWAWMGPEGGPDRILPELGREWNRDELNCIG